MEQIRQLQEMEAAEAKSARKRFAFGAKELVAKGEQAVKANPANSANLEALKAAIATIEARDDRAFLNSRKWVGDAIDARAMIVEVLRAK